jgi:hypothetical protein
LHFDIVVLKKGQKRGDVKINLQGWVDFSSEQRKNREGLASPLSLPLMGGGRGRVMRMHSYELYQFI